MNFFIVKNSINDEWLRDKMLQITRSGQKHLVNSQYPTYIIDDYSELDQYTGQADFLFVQTAGDYILDFDTLWNKIHSIPDSVGLIGHILWEPTDTTPHLHEQCFIIRTAALRGTPLNFVSGTQGKRFIRSKEDLHDGHAPLYVTLDNAIVDRDPGFGTDLMSTILDNGYEVRNFDLSWRFSSDTKIPVVDTDLNLAYMPTRAFLYPEISTETFSRCLKTLELDPALDEAQAQAIHVIKEVMKFNYINVYHWDTIPNDVPADIVMTPANGFMGEAMALTSGAKKIIFYDINHNNIKFKQTVYNQFDGKDYKKFFEDYASTNNLKIEPASDYAVDGANEQMYYTNLVIENWETVKQIEKEYITGSLFNLLDVLIPKIEHRTNLHTSTILGYYIFSNILHDQAEIDNAIERIQEQVNKTNSTWYKER